MRSDDVGYTVKMIADKIKNSGDAELKHLGLTLMQSRVLSFLNAHGGQAAQKEICAYLAVSHPSTVGIISRMMQKGFLYVSVDPGDKRNNIVRLTEKAAGVARKLEAGIASQEKTLLRSLSASEVRAFKRILQVVYKNIE